MNTALFTTTYLEGVDPTASSRLERTVKWLNYMKGLQSELGFQRIIATDNGSSWELLTELSKQTGARVDDNLFGECVLMGETGAPIYITRHHTSLTKTGKNDHDYPYVWRGLYDMADCARFGYYDKIIRIDNDAFILSEKLATFIKDLKSGWTCMGLKGYIHEYPEDAISVICRDSYPLLLDFCKVKPEYHYGSWFERTLPWTRIVDDFVGDRYGNYTEPPQQSAEMDFYCQASVQTKLVFNMEKK